MLKSRLHHAGAGHTHVNGTLRLTNAAESTSHKGIILHRIGEHHQLGTAKAILFSSHFRRFLDDLPHFPHGVHVNACTGGAYVDGRAQPLRFSHDFRDGGQQPLISSRSALLHQCGVTAQEVNPHLVRRLIQPAGNGTGICLTNQAHRRHGDSLIHNGDSQFHFDGLAGLHQIAGHAANLIVNPLAALFPIPIGTVQQVNAQGNGADVEVFFLNHPHGLEDFAGFNHGASLLKYDAWHRTDPCAAYEWPSSVLRPQAAVPD